MEDRFKKEEGVCGICDDCKDRYSEKRCKNCNYYYHKQLLKKLDKDYLKRKIKNIRKLK